jgi:hypothetical protein
MCQQAYEVHNPGEWIDTDAMKCNGVLRDAVDECYTNWNGMLRKEVARKYGYEDQSLDSFGGNISVKQVPLGAKLFSRKHYAKKSLARAFQWISWRASDLEVIVRSFSKNQTNVGTRKAMVEFGVFLNKLVPANFVFPAEEATLSLSWRRRMHKWSGTVSRLLKKRGNAAGPALSFADTLRFWARFANEKSLDTHAVETKNN